MTEIIKRCEYDVEPEELFGGRMEERKYDKNAFMAKVVDEYTKKVEYRVMYREWNEEKEEWAWCSQEELKKDHMCFYTTENHVFSTGRYGVVDWMPLFEIWFDCYE